MSKRAEEAALKAYPISRLPFFPGSVSSYDTNEERRMVYKEGYEQAEKETLERAIEWWRPRLCGFLKEGLTEGVLGEFRKAMEEEE